MDYKKEIIKLLEIAKSKGLNMKEVSKKLGKREQYLTEGLSKGGTEDMYNLVKLFVDGLEVAKSNVLQEPIQKYGSISTGKYIETLENYNQTMTAAMQSSLGTIQTAQQVLLSTMSDNQKVLLVVLDTVKADTREILNRLSGGQMTSEGRRGDPVLPVKSKGRRSA